MGFSVLQFKLFFKSVFPVFVFKNFGFSVLMFIAVCGFYVFRDLVFDNFRQPFSSKAFFVAASRLSLSDLKSEMGSILDQAESVEGLVLGCYNV